MPNKYGHPVKCRCSGECTEEALAYKRADFRAYQARHPDRVRDNARAAGRAYRARHSERERARGRAKYAARDRESRERQDAHSRAWKERNPEKVLATSRAYRERNREIRYAQAAEWRTDKQKATAKAALKNRRWMDAEIAVALDMDRTAVEVALLLGRTVGGVRGIRDRYKLT